MRNSRSRLRAGKVAAVASAAVLALVACGGGGGSTSSSSASSSDTAAAPASAPEGAIKIGVLTTCGGPFATFEAQSLSGAKYALVKDAGGPAPRGGPSPRVGGGAPAGRKVRGGKGRGGKAGGHNPPGRGAGGAGRRKADLDQLRLFRRHAGQGGRRGPPAGRERRRADPA